LHFHAVSTFPILETGSIKLRNKNRKIDMNLARQLRETPQVADEANR
jgi:hypothetical protein